MTVASLVLHHMDLWRATLTQWRVQSVLHLWHQFCSRRKDEICVYTEWVESKPCWSKLHCRYVYVSWYIGCGETEQEIWILQVWSTQKLCTCTWIMTNVWPHSAQCRMNRLSLYCPCTVCTYSDLQPRPPHFRAFLWTFEHWTRVGSVANMIQSISCLGPQYWWQTSPTYFLLLSALWMWKDSASIQRFACRGSVPKVGMMLTVSCCVP